VSLQNRCAIVCQNARNEETWVDVHHADIPDNVRKAYEKCRKDQLSSFRESLTITKEQPNNAWMNQNESKSPTFTRKKTRQELENFQDEEPLEGSMLKKEKRQSTICQDNASVMEKIGEFNDLETIKSNVHQILHTISDIKFVRFVGKGMHGIVF
jgi:hypothetical protein